MSNLNAISVATTLRYSAGKASASLATSYTADQVGDKYEAGVAAITTTETTLDKGGVVNIGYISVRNMDPTNFVQIGHLTGVYSIKLSPGKGLVTQWNTNTVFIKADTATVEVEYLIIEA